MSTRDEKLANHNQDSLEWKKIAREAKVHSATEEEEEVSASVGIGFNSF